MDLFLRLGEVGRLANIREPLLYYRWHLSSITHRRNPGEAYRLIKSMVKEACQRRRMPEPVFPDGPPEGVEKSDSDRKIEHFHRWSFEAAKAGRFAVARKYALAAWRLEPGRKTSWWIFSNSVVGVRVTALLSACYRRISFWKVIH